MRIFPSIVSTIALLIGLLLPANVWAQDLHFEFWGGVHAEVATMWKQPKSIYQRSTPIPPHWGWTPLVGGGMEINGWLSIHLGLAWNLIPRDKKIPIIFPTPVVELSVHPGERMFFLLEAESHVHDKELLVEGMMVPGVRVGKTHLGLGGSIWPTEVVYAAGPTLYISVSANNWLTWHFTGAVGSGMSSSERVMVSTKWATALEFHYGGEHSH